jgi:hypothetical protein
MVKAIAFGNIVRADLRKAMDYSRQHAPAIYKRDYEGRGVLDGLFSGFEGERPVIAISSFSLDQAGELHERLIRVPDDAGNNIAMSGEQQAALSFLAKNPDWPTTDFPRLAKRLVELVIAEKPANVGPPISILEITSVR